MALDSPGAPSCPSTEPSTFALIVARHEERIDWVFHYVEHYSLIAFIYSDGRSLKAWAHVPLALPPRVHVRRMAKRGLECSKYLRHIIDCRASLHLHEWLIFTQGYPFDHSPDFAGLMQSASHWTGPMQVLSYYGHPPPWGPPALHNGSLRASFVAGRWRVWCSRMSDRLQAEEWWDPWLATTAVQQGGREHPVRLSTWWRRHNVTLPLPPAERVCKMYGSIFAVEPYAVTAHPPEFWEHILSSHSSAPSCLQLESMWQPLLVAADRGGAAGRGGRRRDEPSRSSRAARRAERTAG